MGGNWPAPNASTATLGPGGAAVSICDPFFHQDQDRLSDQKAVQNHIQPHVLKLGSGDAGDVFLCPVLYVYSLLRGIYPRNPGAVFSGEAGAHLHQGVSAARFPGSI